tara:strand:- start:758 stop:1909 length:1152 start_codon:yes stop_codon:yes gene_type:complete
MKTKIALIDSVAARGGSHHFYLFGQSTGLINNGVEVNLYTNDITKDPNIKNLKIYHYYKGIFGRRFNFIAGLLYCIGSVRSIFHAKLIGSTICHYHLFHINILVLFDLLLTKVLRMKVVYTIHDVISNLQKNQSNRLLAKFVLKLADKLITHNQFSQKQMEEMFNFKKQEIAIIPHGNYIPFINIQNNIQDSRDLLNIPREKKVILFFGMIKRIKGLEILLSSLSIIKEKIPDILLVIAGKAWEDDFSVYQKIIDKYNLQDYCIIRNHYILSEHVDHYFSSTNLVVLPYKRISQSGVLMMAASYKKAVLCSNLTPFMEVMTDNQTAFFFESERPKSLANKVIQIFGTNNLLDQVAEAGFSLINESYNWDVIGKRLQKEYKFLS